MKQLTQSWDVLAFPKAVQNAMQLRANTTANRKSWGTYTVCASQFCNSIIHDTRKSKLLLVKGASMTIYTSYYRGQIQGEAVSISLYPPPNWKGKHLPLFAPTPELLKWWKSLAQDEAAQQEYKRHFHEILQSRQQLIELWVNKQKQSGTDITLCCYEKLGDFCHRHIVGREVIKRSLPQLWGGEVGQAGNSDKDTNLILTLKPITQLNKGNALTDTPNISNTLSKQSYTPITTNSITSLKTSDAFLDVKDKLIPPLNSSYPHGIQRLLSNCYDAGYFVQCLRLPCGYYQISLGDEDLGDWSELGLLGVLSGLCSDFYRARLVPSLLAAPESTPKPQPVVTPKTESPSLIARGGKLEGEKLAQVQDWCESVKHLMFPSTSGYADGRRELHLRRFVKLTSAKSGRKAEVKTINSSMYPRSTEIEALGEKLLSDFHQALVLFYPAGTQIKVHRDSPAYASGAAQINVIGRAQFSISGCQDTRRMESYWLEPGDCISFDNKQPHGIERVLSDRWCICFFKLKTEYLVGEKVQQLSLI